MFRHCILPSHIRREYTKQVVSKHVAPIYRLMIIKYYPWIFTIIKSVKVILNNTWRQERRIYKTANYR